MENILICLDTDPQPSVFDGIVAVDAGAEHLFRHGGVRPEHVARLVQGALFTRGGTALKHTAVFIGGSDVAAGEKLLAAAQAACGGQLRVSIMHDSSGCNTTAAAAAVAAGRHLPLSPETIATVIGTGPVGQRTAQLLVQAGVEVRLASRRLPRAEAQCHHLALAVEGARLTPCTIEDLEHALDGARLVIAAGAAGVELIDAAALQAARCLRVAIDLNAIPPLGISGIAPTNHGTKHGDLICYGAWGVGGLKMKIHKAAIARLFQTHDAVLDAEAIYALAKKIVGR